MSNKLNHFFSELKNVKLSEVRSYISKECYERSFFKIYFWLLIDIAVFSSGMAMVFMFNNILLKLLGGFIAGRGTMMLFVWGHDSAHGALFKSKSVGLFWGQLTMLPSLHSCSLWQLGHNKVHHGFTSFSPIDWIWKPLQPEEYLALSSWGRFCYRIERNFYTHAFHYINQVWLKKMMLYNGALLEKIYVLVYFLTMSALCYLYAGGVIGVLTGVVLPVMIFMYGISFIVYVHHTHPDIPFFFDKSWNKTIGMLYCTTIIKESRFIRYLSHNIKIHTPHHIDPRIPFYNLHRAYLDLKVKYGKYIHEYDFTWSKAKSIFSKCNVYDIKNQKWLSFKELMANKADYLTVLKETEEVKVVA